MASRKEMLLVQLMEEGAELAVETSKCFRFGPTEQLKGHEFNNIERVINEFNDIYAVLSMLREEGVVPGPFVNLEHQANKKKRVEQYLNYSRECGVLDE